MSTEIIAPPPAPVEGLSQGARVINIFFAPSKTFRDINRSAAWWLPIIIITIVSYAFIFTVDKKVGFDKLAENNMRMNPRQADQLDQLPADQRAQQMEKIVVFTKVFTYGFPVLSLGFFALMALLLWGSYSFGAGAQISFSKTMAVVVYANLVSIFRGLLAIISLYAGADVDTFNIQNPAATNLGFFVSPLDHKVLFALGSQLDVCVIWAMCLAAIGFTYVCKVKKGTSFAIVFGWWLLLVLISVGAAAAFS